MRCRAGFVEHAREHVAAFHQQVFNDERAQKRLQPDRISAVVGEKNGYDILSPLEEYSSQPFKKGIHMKLVINDTIFDDFPEVVLGVVILHGIDNTQDRAEITQMLRQAEAALPEKFGGTPVIEHPYIATWREAYRKFGAKPKDYPSSIENLSRRVLNGAVMGHINNLVSIYNTVSMKYILPVGGEDLDKIEGDILLTRAGEDEPAVFLLGEKEARAPRAGEILYKDDAGAVCRRWNWKEAERTKLTQATRNAFLVIEALPPVPRETVEAAVRELAELVRQYCGGTVTTAILDKEHPEVHLI